MKDENIWDKPITDKEFEQFEVMANHFIQKEPNGPFWIILKRLISEIHRLKLQLENKNEL